MPSSANSTDSAQAQTSPEASTAAAPTTNRTIRSLMLLVVTLALLPVCVISFAQGYYRFDRDRDVVRDKLTESVLAVSSQEQNIFALAQQVLNTLGRQAEVQSGAAGCREALRNVLIGVPYFSNISRIGRDGEVICAAVPGADGLSIVDRNWWRTLDWNGGFQLTEPMFGPASKRMVLVGVMPQHDTAGRPNGTLNIAIDLNWLERALKSRRLNDGAVIALVAASGKIYASSTTEALPDFGRPTPEDESEVREIADGNGRMWSFSAATLVPDRLFVAFAMPNDLLYASTYLHVGTDLVSPIIALILAWAAIWLGTERWVTQGIRDLRALAALYTKGEYEARMARTLHDSAEISSLTSDLHLMADQALERNRRLKDALKQKDLLVREVNHRVKNNLQIVMSLLSLQAGRLKNVEARSALEQARLRIGALALVHRLILEMEMQSAVDTRYLFGELCTQLRHAHQIQNRGIELVWDVERLYLHTDTATPLTLFAVEAITNALTHGFPPGEKGAVHLSLTSSDEKGTLTIEDNGVGYDPNAVQQGTGMRLLKAFVNQLAGEMSVDSSPGGPTRVSIRFSAIPPAAP